jgi:regulatory protein
LPARAPQAPVTAFGRALRRLGRRDHSEGELRRALLRDGFPAPEVDEALGRLRGRGWLDDGEFAYRFARSRMTTQGMGRQRVRQALRQRAVGREEVERGLAAALQEVSEAGAIDALARRYWRQRASDEPARRVRRLWAFLVRRGFPRGLVTERIAALWPRWREALEGLEIGEPADPDTDLAE